MVLSRQRLDSVGSSLTTSLSSSSLLNTSLSSSSLLNTSLSSSLLNASLNLSLEREEDLLDLLEETEVDQTSVCLAVNIPDGRLRPEGVSVQGVSRTVLRVEGLAGDMSCVSLKLATTHYAFSLKRSSTIRTVSSFYTLAGILKSQHPTVSVPSLPVRPLIYLASPRSRAQQLAGWLAQVLVDRQLLSNRALHLFLQTNYSAQRILENAAGARDDQVVDGVVRDERKISKDGFRSLFGSSFEGSSRYVEQH